MKKINKILTIFLVISIMCSNFTTIFAKQVSESEKINLVHDHDCLSVLKFKGKDMLKGVAYVCYKDKETGISYPAFCVQPDKEGVGTGAGDSYDVTLSQLDNPILWRMLYYGYVGSSYKERGLECDDDLYYATKTAVHCFVDGTTPEGKYEVPTRVGYGENATLKEVQRRGAKVLEVAQEIYNYGYNSKDNYIKAEITISKGEQTELTLDGTKYIIQKYSVNANKELSSYQVNITNFPEGTRILNNSNKDSNEMTNSTFKIAIPIKMLTKNFTGNININNAQVKSYPIFYADSGNKATQNYVVIDKSEVVNKSTKLDIDVFKSSLKIVKKDDEGVAVSGAIFNIKYEDGTNIGDFTTNDEGTIIVNKLRQGKIIVTEKSVPNGYTLDTTEKNVTIEYNSTSNLEVINKLKKGQIRIIKVDKDNNKIKLQGVTFEILDESNNIVETLVTDENGEALSSKYNLKDYTTLKVREKETLSEYVLSNEIKEIELEENEIKDIIFENEKQKQPELPKLPRTGF